MKNLFQSYTKQQLSWALYDWANSTYSTTVMAGFFPVFFKEYWSFGFDPSISTARLGGSVSVASFIVAFLTPFLGAVADRRPWKKKLLFSFMIMGAISCGLMASTQQGDWQLAAVLYGIALIGFSGSSNFYDSLLPHIASGHKADDVSSLGYSLGYLGGGLLFLVNVMMFLHPQLFGLPNGVAAVKASFVTVAIWWIVFTIPLMMIVPEPGVESVSQESIFSLIGSSVRQMIHSCQDLARDRNLLLFVLSFWLYIDGVYTVITMAVDYGISLGFRSQDLIAALLITQFVGFPAAYFFGKMAPKIGCRIPISICIGIYAVTVIGATQMTQAYQFYILAAVIGLVQGGVQSLSRSMFSRMIPKEKSGEYFGLFNLVGKFASILGPMIVAATALVVHEPRLSMLGLLFLFALGASLLYFVKEPQT